MKSIKILENPSEIGAGTRGSSLGIDALKIASVLYKSDYFLRYQRTVIPDENQMLFEKNKTETAIRIEGITAMYEKISRQVKETLNAGEFPLLLSGDHSNAGGTIAGIKMAYPEERIGVIWIDAHADLHTPYTSPSGNVHGMPLCTALGYDHNEDNDKTPKKETIQYWEEMKNTGGITPKIAPNDIVIIGLRSYEEQEEELIKQHNIKHYTAHDVFELGTSQVGEETINYLKECDKIYISFDADSLDPSISRGTGTPVENGLMTDQVEDLITTFIARTDLCTFEITEINPLLDDQNKMAMNIFPLLEKFTEMIKGKD